MSKGLLKSLLPRSLFGRSLLILVVPIVIVQLVTMVVFFDRHWSRVIGSLSYALAGEVSVIAERIEASPENAEAISALAIHYLDLEVTYEADAVLNAPGFVKADFGWERIVSNSFIPALKRSLEREFTLRLEFEERWAFLDIQLSHGVMRVSFPQKRLFSSSGYVYLLWVLGAAIVLSLVAVIFMRNQIRPIRKLAAASERFGRGRDLQFFKPEGAREVRQAGEAFLRMSGNIKRQREQRALMLAGVSHDLRTPLTRLKLQLSMLDGPDAENMRGDIDDMECMIAGYLDFVRGERDENEENIDVLRFLQGISSGFEGQKSSIEVKSGESVTFSVRPIAFERCISNIVSNAVRYADDVYLSYEIADNGLLHIVIEDNGPGLPEDQYEDVFKPFYRGDTARANPEGSVGLGLSIAMDVVHMHGGRIWLDKGGYGGLAVHIQLPV